MATTFGWLIVAVKVLLANHVTDPITASRRYLPARLSPMLGMPLRVLDAAIGARTGGPARRLPDPATPAARPRPDAWLMAWYEDGTTVGGRTTVPPC